MTTTSISDVKGMLGNFAPGKLVNASSGSDVSFRSIWESQTTGGRMEGSGQNADNLAKKAGSTSKVGSQTKDSLKAKETQTKDVVKSGKPEELSEENLEEAMQVLNTAAEGFFTQVAEELGLTEEELGSLMEELDMSKLDLLQPQKLTELVLAAGGEENVLSLLTNENLYQTMQGLQEMLGVVMEQAAQDTGLSVEKLAGILEQVSVKETEPVIELEVQEETAVDSKQQDKTSQEDVPQENLDADKTMTGQNPVEKVAAKSTGHDSRQEGAADRQEGSFMQNLTEQLELAGEMKTPYVSGQDVSVESIMRQIMDYMKVQVKPDMSSVEMQLHPENLGTLHIQLSTKQGAVTAQFVTQNEAVKAALESQMIQLKESFDEQGVKVDAIEVTVQTHEFERNLDQGKGQNQGEPDKKNKVRKLNLNLPEQMEEDLTEEEQLAVEMMTANGGTVDYTA